jgi:GTPase SAR1 family protein
MGAHQSCLPLRWNLPKHEQHHLHQVQQSPQPLPQLLQRLPRGPNVQFRVLIIGRANAGKTSILQRVCDTTESPEIYRVDPSGTRESVCSRPRSRVFALIISPGSTRPHYRGWACLFLLMIADSEDPACSVANTTSRTNSSSQIIKAMLSTTPADSSLAVRKS